LTTTIKNVNEIEMHIANRRYNAIETCDASSTLDPRRTRGIFDKNFATDNTHASGKVNLRRKGLRDYPTHLNPKILTLSNANQSRILLGGESKAILDGILEKQIIQ